MNQSLINSSMNRDIKNLIVACELMLDELKKIKRRRYYRKYYLARKTHILQKKKDKQQKDKEAIDSKEYILYFD